MKYRIMKPTTGEAIDLTEFFKAAEAVWLHNLGAMAVDLLKAPSATGYPRAALFLFPGVSVEEVLKYAATYKK